MTPKQRDPRNEPTTKKQTPLRPPSAPWSTYFKAGPVSRDEATQRLEAIAQAEMKLLQNKTIPNLTPEDLKAIAEKVDSNNPEEKAAAIEILKSKWSSILSDYANKTSFSWACNIGFFPSRDTVIEANKREEALINEAERAFWSQTLTDTTKQRISELAKRDLTTMNDSDFVAWVDFALKPEIL